MGQADAWIRGGAVNTPDKSAIRDAATLILTRDSGHDPKVLMGMRGAAAAFMPEKFVFPGGALDASDGAVPLARPLAPTQARRLAALAPADLGPALAAAAVRELWEETGQILGRPAPWPDPPGDWAGFAATGHRPDAGALSFVFRAITPAGRTRRFDARFFLAAAEDLAGDPDDFTGACDELSQLQWVPIRAARSFNLPFITEVVLAEVARILEEGPQDSVPFFDNATARSAFHRIR